MKRNRKLLFDSIGTRFVLSLGILTSCYISRADSTAPPFNNCRFQGVVSLKAEPFPLSDVRLLDGPFKSAMERDANYLLELDPERLLRNFRINAGLASTAKPLGNWEAPNCELRGHFTGHYLSACALMYASTGDERFKQRADYLVAELAKCQTTLGSSGYLSAFPESFLDRLEAAKRVWAPYYTLHKIHAGLLDVHQLCGNAQALDVASKMGDWVKARTDRLTDDQVENMLGVEHGGINESMANLYALTGNTNYLRVAERLFHKHVLEPLAAGQDKLAGLHANTQFPKVIGTARLYELTGQDRYHTISKFFWETVVNYHSYVNGGNSDHEGFGPPDKLNSHVSPYTCESCNTYNMLKLTRHLFAWDALPAEADYYERALYNHILASQDPRTGMMAYHVPVYGGWFMPYNTTNNSEWCCTGSGIENHAKYGESIYWHDAEGLFVDLFIPSELTWREKSLTVHQETRYPEDDAVRLTLACRQPVSLALRLRYPGWAQRGMQVRLNGKEFSHHARPGSFVTLNRTWKNGDRIEVKLPMDLRLEPMSDNPARVAICYGPLVLAGELGSDGIIPPMPYAVGQGDFFRTKPPPMPVLVTDKPISKWVRQVSANPLVFQTRNVGQPKDITLVPFYMLPPQRYSLYWDLVTPEQFKANQNGGSNLLNGAPTKP